MISWIIVFIISSYYLYLKFYCSENEEINKKKIMISIEGNIGVGKTTLMDMLKEKLHEEAEFIYEPIQEWQQIKDNNGKDILQTYYDDIPRWSYTFQNIAYITRLKRIVKTIKNSNKKYIILDRSLLADLNTFAKMLHENGNMNAIEWNAYNQWNQYFENNYGDDVTHQIIYLRSEPDIAFMRIQMRNREAEKNIAFEYIKLLHDYHEKWLMNNKKDNNILMIDANRDFVKGKIRFNEIYNKILQFTQIK